MALTRTRPRLLAASALALALSAAALPSIASAQDGPETPVRGLLQAIVEKRFSDLEQYFCPEFASQAADLDLGAALASSLPAGVDPQVATDAIQFTVTGPEGVGEPVITVVSEDAAGSTLDVEATLIAGLDPANSDEFIRAVVMAQLEGQGMEVTEENIAAFMTLLEGQLEGQEMFTQDISTTVLVTQEGDGSWLICSPLAGPSASASASSGPAASEPPLASVAPAASMAPAASPA